MTKIILKKQNRVYKHLPFHDVLPLIPKGLCMLRASHNNNKTDLRTFYIGMVSIERPSVDDIKVCFETNVAGNSVINVFNPERLRNFNFHYMPEYNNYAHVCKSIEITA